MKPDVETNLLDRYGNGYRCAYYVWCRFGVPRTLTSDWGTKFVALLGAFILLIAFFLIIAFLVGICIPAEERLEDREQRRSKTAETTAEQTQKTNKVVGWIVFLGFVAILIGAIHVFSK